MYLDSKNEHPGQGIRNFTARTGHTDTLCCSYDLDLDSVTLIYHFDLYIVKIYQHIKNELSSSMFQQFELWGQIRVTQVQLGTLPSCIWGWPHEKKKYFTQLHTFSSACSCVSYAVLDVVMKYNLESEITVTKCCDYLCQGGYVFASVYWLIS